MCIQDVYQKVDSDNLICRGTLFETMFPCIVGWNLRTRVCPKEPWNQLPGNRLLRHNSEYVAALFNSVAPSSTENQRKKSQLRESFRNTSHRSSQVPGNQAGSMISTLGDCKPCPSFASWPEYES
jgi:hypothetical protein